MTATPNRSPAGGTRRCPRCGVDKPREEWHASRWGRGGYCIPCDRAYRKRWHEEYRLAHGRSYRSPVLPEPKPDGRTPCAAPGCDRLTEQFACKLHRSVPRGAAKESKPFALGYHNTHRYVRTLYGRASEHICCDCGDRAADWAWTHRGPSHFDETAGRYGLDPSTYVPMCRRCHAAYDDKILAVYARLTPRQREELLELARGMIGEGRRFAA